MFLYLFLIYSKRYEPIDFEAREEVSAEASVIKLCSQTTSD